MCQGFQCRPVGGRVLLKVEVDRQNVRVWRAPVAPAGSTAAPAASNHLARWLSDLFCCGVLCRDCAIRAYGVGVWEVLGRPPGFVQVQVSHQPSAVSSQPEQTAPPGLLAKLAKWLRDWRWRHQPEDETIRSVLLKWQAEHPEEVSRAD
jgi:hypothetical protein